MRGTEKPGVMLYWESFRALKRLNDQQVSRIFFAIGDYAQYGEIPDFSDDLTLEFAWSVIQERIDRDTDRYEQKKRRNRESGIISDFTRNYAPAHGIDPNDEAAKADYLKRRLAEIEAEEVNER